MGIIVYREVKMYENSPDTEFDNSLDCRSVGKKS